MSAHNFWHNFTHGFMHGMFNSNPFFGCWGGFGPMWGNPFMFGGFNSCFGMGGWNSGLFLTPSVFSGNFYSLTPELPMPSMNMNINMSELFPTENVWDMYNKQYSSFAGLDTFKKTTPPVSENQLITEPAKTQTPEAGNKTAPEGEKNLNDSNTGDKNITRNANITNTIKDDDAAFDKMLEFVLQAEGGYVANDAGEAGNRGVRQSTYDTYRKSKGLAVRDVKELTLEETKEIYHKMYYVASGADKIEDPILAFQVFDTAVNMGVGAAKKLLSQCGGDADKFKELRLKRYENIAANNPSKAIYLKGWKNRVNNLDSYADRNFKALT